MGARFQNLVEMQRNACQVHHKRKMYGTKLGKSYIWTTYGEFGRLVDEFRGGLASLGVSRGDKVAVIANNCVEWAVGAYAVYGLGAHYVPMYESQKMEDWQYIIRDSGSNVLLVTNPEIYGKTVGLTGEIGHLSHVIPMFEDGSDISYTQLCKTGRDNPKPVCSPDQEEPMGLIYTSGTTGNPKGVILSHKNLLTELDALDQVADGLFSPEDRGLSFLPWGHLMGQIQEVHLLLYNGYSSGLVKDINEIAEDFALVRPTIFFSVPRLFNKIYDGVYQKMKARGGLIFSLFLNAIQFHQKAFRGESLGVTEKIRLGLAQKLIFSKIRKLFGDRLRLSFSGGASLSKEVAEFMDCIGVPVYEGFGQTETTMAVTMNTPGGRKLGSVGRPVPHAKVILDTSVESTAEGEGEIVVYGSLIMKGYHNLPEETRKTIDEDGGLRTGDLGRFDEDGYLYLTGRIKEIYKLENGKYISPSPMEEVLKNSPFINQVMIAGANRLNNVALIIPEELAVRNFAQEQNMDMDKPGWQKDPRIYQLIEKEVDIFSRSFKKFERLARFELIWDEWSPENGLLTPTLKLKRRLIMERYQELIDKLHRVN